MAVFQIHHITKYEYDRPVKESVNEIRIYPFTGKEQELLHHELNITGRPDVLVIKDYWGNRAGMFNLLSSHKELVIESKLTVRTLGTFPGGEKITGNFQQLKVLGILPQKDYIQLQVYVKGNLMLIGHPPANMLKMSH